MPWRRNVTVLTPHTSFLLWDGPLREPSHRVSLCLLTDSAGPDDSPRRRPSAAQGQGLCLWFAEVVEKDKCRKLSLGTVLFSFYFSLCLMPLHCPPSGETENQL